MTHLNITQGSTIETVSAQIVKKLYETALTVSEPLEGETDAAYMSGHISVPHAYAEYVEYLAGEIGEGNNGVVTSRIQNPTGRFQDLTIDVTNGIYVNFEDSNVESILATNFGDGVGITQTTVASITSFGGNFANSNIVSFNELPQFTNITEINSNNRFNNCTSLTSIDLSNITKISGENGYQRWNFEYCSNLESVGDTSNCTYFGQASFNGCSKLTVVDATNATEFYASAFYGCTNLNLLIDQSKITKIQGASVFRGCSKIQAFSSINMPNLTGEILGQVFQDCTQIENVVNLGKITAIGQPHYGNGVFGGCTNLETVVLPETVTKIYKSLISRPVRWVKLLSTVVPEYDTSAPDGVSSVYGGSFGEVYRNKDVTDVYQGHTYPIYVKDELLSQYQAADIWKYVGPGRLRPLSQFSTDFPNG